MDAVPEYTPMSTNEFRKAMFALGATEETLGAYVKGFNRRAEIAEQRGGSLVLGVRLCSCLSYRRASNGATRTPAETSDKRPECLQRAHPRLPLRHPHLGRGYGYGQFFLDFFDLERRVFLNVPAGHALYPATVAVTHDADPGYPPAGYPMPLNPASFGLGEIRSRERNQNMHSFPKCEERWSIPEGAYITLQRTGHPDFLFQMPTRRTSLSTYPQRLCIPTSLPSTSLFPAYHDSPLDHARYISSCPAACPLLKHLTGHMSTSAGVTGPGHPPAGRARTD